MVSIMGTHRKEEPDDPNTEWPSTDEDPPVSKIELLVRKAFRGTYLREDGLEIYHKIMHNSTKTRWTAFVSTIGIFGVRVYYEIYHDGQDSYFVGIADNPEEKRS